MIFKILALMAFATCILAAINDFRQLRLPNILMIILLALYSQYAYALYMEGHGAQIKTDLIVAGILFIITAALFAFGIMGAGDAKMISIAGLWIGITGFPAFLLGMSLSGMALALIGISLRKRIQNKHFYSAIPLALRPNGGWLHRLHSGKNAIPYGIAITIGIACAFYGNGYLTIIP